MRTVYKYTIECNSIVGEHWRIEVEVPEGGKPLYLAEQGGKTCLWVEADDQVKSQQKLVFACVGTGHGRVPGNGTYFASVQQHGFVWHLYRLL